MAPNTLSTFLNRLVAKGLINENSAIEAQNRADEADSSVYDILLSQYNLSSEQLTLATAEQFGIPYLDLSAFDPAFLPEEAVNETLTRKHGVIPLSSRGKKLFIAITDPLDHSGIDEYRFMTGSTPSPVLVEKDKLLALTEHLFSSEDIAISDFDEEEFGAIDDLDISSAADDDSDIVDVDGENDTPVVKFVNKMLLNAIKLGSSDLHFEPYEYSYRVRFRTDGVLHEVSCPPIALSPRIASRLKIMSSMDISERRKPQDGRIKLKLSKTRAIDFRVNTLPTLWGEKIVLRILDPTSAQMGIDALGYEDDQKTLYMEALSQPQGMILVTGPTGSGKTVSLYTGLNILNTTERNISTAEDPVEINLEGINQVNVNPKQGMDFSGALKAFLRQDPDIIMVGEIRDLETANIAIKAAQTGHMVMSTLHTNSAPETLTRLQNIGVPAFNIATSVSLIIAQRLARRLCKHCKTEDRMSRNSLLEEGIPEDLLNSASIYAASPNGCSHCAKGYKGRVGVYEVVKITPSLQKVIMNEGNSLQIAEVAEQEGFNNLRQSGLKKVLQGVTSLEEVNRVTLD
ncbi:type IV-A pilus assembly ATPase PilB [Endozoicomonas gorgoniicola]|uniref:Type IV-A pilus assembly ATPase PilB n=1 Tax=Endozoicomonas gorgoniicola TaxID=1234144 RepID=A0ABT3MXX1_9GAMM|nr:type IV-A pilus assembly ATPase PilB [Endozoicomonas gorgoniicola]MCW7554212.1 type IV-A pilus assembly ATPase PilB [Endozoicomonas gorgoniicola]